MLLNRFFIVLLLIWCCCCSSRAGRSRKRLLARRQNEETYSYFSPTRRGGSGLVYSLIPTDRTPLLLHGVGNPLYNPTIRSDRAAENEDEKSGSIVKRAAVPIDPFINSPTNLAEIIDGEQLPLTHGSGPRVVYNLIPTDRTPLLLHGVGNPLYNPTIRSDRVAGNEDEKSGFIAKRAKRAVPIDPFINSPTNHAEIIDGEQLPLTHGSGPRLVYNLIPTDRTPLLLHGVGNPLYNPTIRSDRVAGNEDEKSGFIAKRAKRAVPIDPFINSPTNHAEIIDGEQLPLTHGSGPRLVYNLIPTDRTPLLLHGVGNPLYNPTIRSDRVAGNEDEKSGFIAKRAKRAVPIDTDIISSTNLTESIEDEQSEDIGDIKNILLTDLIQIAEGKHPVGIEEQLEPNSRHHDTALNTLYGFGRNIVSTFLASILSLLRDQIRWVRELVRYSVDYLINLAVEWWKTVKEFIDLLSYSFSAISAL